MSWVPQMLANTSDILLEPPEYPPWRYHRQYGYVTSTLHPFHSPVHYSTSGPWRFVGRSIARAICDRRLN